MTEDGRTVFEETSLAFSHLREMEAEIEAINNQLATRTDYESEEYLGLIDKVAAMSEKFYAIDMTHFEEDVEKTLLGLGFERSDFDRQTSEFSGGWRMRIELAKLLLKNPDVLLLDEPEISLHIIQMYCFSTSQPTTLTLNPSAGLRISSFRTARQ